MSKYEVYDANIYGVRCNSDSFGFRITWDANVGFGQFDFKVDGEFPHNIFIDNECMSREFIKEVLCKIADKAILESDK